MSRLESMRRRIAAQIDGLNWALAEVAQLEGDMLEIGLGNGRTYDHLREYGDGRRILVIDRALNSHPSCIPPAADYYEGEAEAMMTQMADEGVRLAMAHYELGRGVHDDDEAEARMLSPYLVRLMMPGGLIVSQQPIIGIGQIDGPANIAKDRYLFYRA